MILYGISFLLAGIIMFIITLCAWLKYKSFENSETLIAAVTDVNTGSYYLNGRRHSIYKLVLTYSVDGVEYTRELPCDKEEYNRGAGREKEIRYKPANPKKIINAESEKDNKNMTVLWLITLALFVIGAVMLIL